MPNDIGKTLKDCRTSAKMTVKEISDLLTGKGYKASESTIYSWENGNSQPTPGALLTMCTAYGVDDVLSVFGYNGYKEDGSLQLNIKEQNLIEKYRSLDPYGQETVSMVLDRELQRIMTLQKALEQKDARIAELEAATTPRRIITYYQRLASAGSGEYLFDSIPTDTIEVPITAVSEQADFVIGVNGHSMEPTYCEGEKVYVAIADEISTGSIGIFIKGEECYIKELGQDKLKSHNKAYPDILDADDIKLVGKVLGKVEE